MHQFVVDAHRGSRWIRTSPRDTQKSRFSSVLSNHLRSGSVQVGGGNSWPDHLSHCRQRQGINPSCLPHDGYLLRVFNVNIALHYHRTYLITGSCASSKAVTSST